MLSQLENIELNYKVCIVILGLFSLEFHRGGLIRRAFLVARRPGVLEGLFRNPLPDQGQCQITDIVHIMLKHCNNIT